MESLNNKNIIKTQIIDCNSQDFKPTRIDKYLFNAFPDYSRSYFQNLINQDLIQVNSKEQIKSNYKLKLHDQIKISFPKPVEYDVSPQKIEFETIAAEKDFIIVNKPAGLVVHPSEYNKEELSLVHGLLYKFKELNDFNDEQRPGIVHRIDKGTSGLLVVARNTKSQIKLANMFKDRKINKTYLAIVNGHPDKTGKIDLSIGRHPKKRHLMTHKGFNPKSALTYYKVIEYYKDTSLVEVKIITGRTHQIRVHLAAIGHGLIGDESYGYNSKLINRPALHAYKISFEYNNQNFEYKTETPKDFKELINHLK